MAQPSQYPEAIPPSGTVTFLFTDIEGSTRLWGERPEAMRRALARHDALLRDIIRAHGGYVFKTIGDAFCAAFDSAPAAVAAAAAIQYALDAEDWGEIGRIRVRAALHTGAAEERDRDYFGPPLNRVARLLATCHGGQVVLSLPTEELSRDSLPAGASLRDMGEHRLKDLDRAERVFQVVLPGLPDQFPPLRSLDAYPQNLPVQLTSFIGREREMGEVTRLLRDTRLLTLAGPGGTGKTRLSLQVAADQIDSFADGVWFVELAPVTDPALVPQAVAAAMRLKEDAGRAPLSALVDALKDREALLVLDNCEHVTDACRTLADALLRSCPRLRILVTTREVFGIAGESTYQVPTLGLPPEPADRPWVAPEQAGDPSSLARYEAVRLFVDRATAVQPAFSVTRENAPAVAAVCRRLDGIPLAIELAAARVKALTVKEIAARLDNRFRLLTGGSRTALPRQQTLRALIDWSYDLLSDLEQAMLRRLSIFSSGWTLDAAEAVVGTPAGAEAGLALDIEDWEVLDLLTQLVDKSLVLVETVNSGRTRYRLLETVRQYGRDRLREAGEWDVLSARHRDFYLALAEEASIHLQGRSPEAWLERLEAEHDNFRAALDWCLAEPDGARPGLRLTGALDGFWYVRGYLREGRARLEAALGRPGAEAPTPERARCLDAAGFLSFRQGDDAAAEQYNSQCLELARQLGEIVSEVRALLGLAYVALKMRDLERARALLEEALPLSRTTNESRLTALLLGNLGVVAHDQGDLERARRYCRESLTVYELSEDHAGGSWLIAFLGFLAYEQRDFRSARDHYSRSLRLEWKLGKKPNLASSFGRFARLAAEEGQPERVVRLHAVADVLRDALGMQLSPDQRDFREADLAAAREALGDAAFEAAAAEGRGMPLEAAVAYALDGDPVGGQAVMGHPG